MPMPAAPVAPVAGSPAAASAWHTPADEALRRERVEFVVLSSSSSGNCSALIFGEGKLRRVALIDCGLSPARTRSLLSLLGLSLDHVDDVLITHLDADHFHPGWLKAVPRRARLHVHTLHAPRAMKFGLSLERFDPCEETITLRSGAVAHTTVLSHDQWGVVAFRIDLGGRALGYATDVGRVTPALTRALAGVDVLAIESNYCPKLQAASERPDFLKRRITGGAGHLSNHECHAAVQTIAPREHVVLLHLSRQCNTPDLVAAAHAGAPYRVTIATPDAPTAPITMAPRCVA